MAADPAVVASVGRPFIDDKYTNAKMHLGDEISCITFECFKTAIIDTTPLDIFDEIYGKTDNNSFTIRFHNERKSTEVKMTKWILNTDDKRETKQEKEQPLQYKRNVSYVTIVESCVQYIICFFFVCNTIF